MPGEQKTKATRSSAQKSINKYYTGESRSVLRGISSLFPTWRGRGLPQEDTSSGEWRRPQTRTPAGGLYPAGGLDPSTPPPPRRGCARLGGKTQEGPRNGPGSGDPRRRWAEGSGIRSGIILPRLRALGEGHRDRGGGGLVRSGSGPSPEGSPRSHRRMGSSGARNPGAGDRKKK